MIKNYYTVVVSVSAFLSFVVVVEGVVVSLDSDTCNDDVDGCDDDGCVDDNCDDDGCNDNICVVDVCDVDSSCEVNSWYVDG